MDGKTSKNAAIEYIGRGLAPIPVPYQTKKPVLTGWTELRITAEAVGKYFNGQQSNIGVLLGEPSGWLIDIDLDHPKAVAMAHTYLPETKAVFGRAGKPRSHFLYRVSAPIATHKRKHDPLGMIVELRSSGCQTVFPPSVHPSGESITWDCDGKPAIVTPKELRECVDLLADAVLRECGIDPAAQTTTKIPQPTKTASGPTRAELVERCWRYVQKMPDAISGQGGHNATLAAACECFRFGLTDAEAEEIMRRFNGSKTGGEPWSDKELDHKLQDAREKVTAAGEFDCRLREDRQASKPATPAPTPTITYKPATPGETLQAGDRGNFGTVLQDMGDSVELQFESPDTHCIAVKVLPKSELATQDGTPLATVTGGDTAALWPTSEYTAADIATGDFSLTWLIDKVLVANQPGIVGGGWKCLKTGSMIDLATSLASGTYFLNHFAVANPVKTGFVSSESGMFTVSETTKRIAEAKDIDLGALLANLVVTPESNDFSSPSGTEQLVAWCKRREFVVVIIDPAYLNFPGLAETSANVFAVGAALRAFSVALLREGITPIVVHHTVKVPLNKFEPLDLASLSGSGWAEFARQWILLNRRRDYQDGSGFHELNLRIGGSAGHSSLWHLDIDEGPSDQAGDRKWRVGLKTAGQAKVDHERRKEEALGRDLADKMALIVTHLEQLPPNFADTETGILRGSIGRTKTAVIALERLVEQRRIIFEDDCVNKAGRKSSRPGYRLVSASGGDEQESDCPV
ncbi:MAG: bifunctional DNA primase/polymerase [Planctomycetota bacterium]|nr:bifunctional DNA primase/polymerase [Planctomycetota bacterium]